jgi:glyoxylase-like metal-dependent hydrolase (beta-lactamase superfamily II)
MLKRIILTHEDADHLWGNHLFPGAEIIAHGSVLPEQMKQVGEPKDRQQLQRGVGNVIKNFVIKATRPGLQAAGKQLLKDYDFDGIQLVFPTTL